MEPKRNHLESEVADALSEQGYFFANFKVDAAVNVKKTADLVVAIIDEGPRAKIAEIETGGNKINSREEIVSYLKFRPGDPYDRKDLFEMKRQLLDSGRFVEVDIKPLAPGHGPQRLRIEVKELEIAPPLGKPLLPEEAILLKFGKWLGDIDRWQGDMVIRTDGSLGTLTIVVSPRRGILATASLKSQGPATSRPDYAVIATQDEVASSPPYAGGRPLPRTCNPRSTWLPALRRRSATTSRFQAIRPSETEGPQPLGKNRQSCKLTFGLGGNLVRVGEAAGPFVLNMKLLPASLVNTPTGPARRACSTTACLRFATTVTLSSLMLAAAGCGSVRSAVQRTSRPTRQQTRRPSPTSPRRLRR